MTDKKGYTHDFNGIVELREAYNERKANLIDQTESNKIWQNTMSDDNIEELSCNTIIQIIDTHCFPKAHENIDNAVFNKYHSALITKLNEDYYKNWDLIQQIQDGILPEEEWPDYDELYIKALPDAKREFDSSPAAVELRQIQEEWRKLAKTPRGDFSSIDWSVSENRSQFCEWLNIYNDKNDARLFLSVIDYSDCYNYEDFCLNAPYWMTHDDSGLLIGEGLLLDLAFLLDNSEELGSCAILEFAIDNLSNAISEYPEEMLYILKEDGDCFPEEILKAVEENFPDIPDDFLEDYQALFKELKE